MVPIADGAHIENVEIAEPCGFCGRVPGLGQIVFASPAYKNMRVCSGCVISLTAHLHTILMQHLPDPHDKVRH